MLQKERQNRILKLLEEKKTATIPELTSEFGVSVITIRRDLDALAAQGLIRKVYGGASLPERQPHDLSPHPSFLARTTRNHPQKERLGSRAASLVQEGDTVILDIGTTCLEIAKALKPRTGITVLTNSLAILNELADSNLEVHALGGRLRGRELSLTGQQAYSAINDYYANKAFISVSGVSLENGLTDFNIDSSELCAVITRRAGHVYLVTDSSKFGKIAFSVIGPLECVHSVITDSGIPSEYTDAFRARGIALILVDGENH